MEKMWFRPRKVIRNTYSQDLNNAVTIETLQAEIIRLKNQNQRLKDRLSIKPIN